MLGACVKKVFFYLAFTTKTLLSILKRIHNSLVELSDVHGFEYIDNCNIADSCLCKDELHLLGEGKCILANNSLFYSKRYILGTRTHHPPNLF